LKTFQVDLKAWFYLTNAAQENFDWFYFVVCPHNLLHPYYEPLLWFMIRPLRINSVSRPPLRNICMRAGGPFPLFHYEIGSLSSHYLPSYSHSKQPNSILDCVFIFYNARIKQTSLHADLLTHWTASHNNMQEKLEDNRRIQNNGTFTAGSNQMWVVDRKQKYYLEWL